MKWEQLAAARGIFVRKCSICGSPVIAGYCVNDGMDYYCSDDCLHMVFTDEEWEIVYQTDGGYYTEWYDEYDENEMDIICNELMSIWKAEADSERGEAIKYRVDWFCDVHHNKNYFPTYEDAFAYAKSIAVCTGVKSVFMLEMTARYGVYDVIDKIK